MECSTVRSREWSRDNREYKRKKALEWQKANPEKAREHGRKASRKRQGLPEPTRPEPDKCECCGDSSSVGLALDHCHKTGAFRGWLCGGCNTSIGRLGDNVEGVEKALNYLKNSLE